MARSQVRDAALKAGWRSGLEQQVGDQLAALGIPAQYEPFAIRYSKPETPSKYTPDFVLPNGIIIETKGRFETEDRKKHKLLKAQHPALDIRFVFSYSRQKIGKKSATTYAMWCDQFGFEYAEKFVPREWLEEPINRAALAAIKKVTHK